MANVLVIGASGGIGTALVLACRARGDQVTGLSRSDDGLDLTDEASVERVLGEVVGPFDLILVATGGLEIAGAVPEKSIKALSQKAMMDQFALNAVGPALVLRYAAGLLQRKGRARIAVLSARVGSIGDNQLGGWISYRSAKAALNQIVHTAAIELRRSHPESSCVALHPGTVATSLTETYMGHHPTVLAPEAAANLLCVIDALTPADTGQFFDWAGKVVPW